MSAPSFHPMLDRARDYYDVQMVNYADPVEWVENEVGVDWQAFNEFANYWFERSVGSGLPPASIFGLAFMWGYSARLAKEAER